LTPNELVFPFGGSYVCANFGENRSRNATVKVLADRQTDRQTDRYTDPNRVYNLSHFAIAMGQIIITVVILLVCISHTVQVTLAIFDYCTSDDPTI